MGDGPTADRHKPQGGRRSQQRLATSQQLSEAATSWLARHISLGVLTAADYLPYLLSVACCLRLLLLQNTGSPAASRYISGLELDGAPNRLTRLGAAQGVVT